MYPGSGELNKNKLLFRDKLFQAKKPLGSPTQRNQGGLPRRGSCLPAFLRARWGAGAGEEGEGQGQGWGEGRVGGGRAGQGGVRTHRRETEQLDPRPGLESLCQALSRSTSPRGRPMEKLRFLW